MAGFLKFCTTCTPLKKGGQPGIDEVVSIGEVLLNLINHLNL